MYFQQDRLESYELNIILKFKKSSTLFTTIFIPRFSTFPLSNRELYHSTSKPINDEEDTLKSFMKFDIMPWGPVFRMIVGSRIVVPQQSLPHNDTLLTRIHDLISNTICQTTSYVILPQNQLVIRKTHSNLLWHLTSHLTGLILKQL